MPSALLFSPLAATVTFGAVNRQCSPRIAPLRTPLAFTLERKAQLSVFPRIFGTVSSAMPE